MSVAVPFDYRTELALPKHESDYSTLGRANSAVVHTEVEDVAELGPLAASYRDGEPRVLLEVESDRGQTQLELPLRIRMMDGRWTAHGIAYGLTLDIDLGDKGEVQWTLEPGGQDAESRARIIDLLHAMTGRGVLVLRDPEFGVISMLRLESQDEVAGFQAERRFLTDVLVLEAWSGVRIPVPDFPEDESLDRLAQGAALVRAAQLNVRFTSDVVATTAEPIDETDELRLGEEVGYDLWNFLIPLGTASYRVAVEPRHSRQDADGRWQTVFRPQRDWISAQLVAPAAGAAEFVRLVDNGMIPERPNRLQFDQADARRRADALVAEWTLDKPEDQTTRDELRRRWPM